MLSVWNNQPQLKNGGVAGLNSLVIFNYLLYGLLDIVKYILSLQHTCTSGGDCFFGACPDTVHSVSLQ